MEAAIITVAGVSSRFNEGIPEEDKCLKAIYFEEDRTSTLLYHLLEKCMFADMIVIAGGYKYDDLKSYCEKLPNSMKDKLVLTYNEHYADLGSGYSLYVGLKEIFDKSEDVEGVLFVEGDLDIDRDSFSKVAGSGSNVLSYSFEPIYSRKAVVLYKDAEEHYKYAFNSSHGLLKIDEAFSLILNSGQIWKFTDTEKLRAANEKFYETGGDGTNLRIIQNYIDLCDTESFELIGLLRWTNCNTRGDYGKILEYWKEDAK
ncbi:MAG: hypothetical protein K2K63_02260 [Acetatifactor sp.]|nr:hypothetical protein [Acetatifactor sp.]